MIGLSNLEARERTLVAGYRGCKENVFVRPVSVGGFERTWVFV